MIVTVDHGRVREVRLNRPPVNALNPPLMMALRTELARAVSDGCGGVVVSGTPGIFSAGLDVPELLRLGPVEMRATWALLFDLLRDIACSDIPIAAALTGHSPAGGTVLAVVSDYRVLAEGPFRLGLNEVQVGLPVPDVIFSALRHVVGARQAERLAVGGLLVGPEEALRCGLVDEVVAAAEVIPRAVAWTTELVSRPAAAMASTRRLARAPLRQKFDVIDAALVDSVVEQWFSAETQETMRAVAARLGKGNG